MKHGVKSFGLAWLAAAFSWCLVPVATIAADPTFEPHATNRTMVSGERQYLAPMAIQAFGGGQKLLIPGLLEIGRTLSTWCRGAKNGRFPFRHRRVG